MMNEDDDMEAARNNNVPQPVTQNKRKRKELSEEQKEKHRARNRNSGMTPYRQEQHRAVNRNTNMSEDRLDSHRAVNRNTSMSEDRLESHRAVNRNINMSEDRLESHRAVNRTTNMTNEQIQSRRQSQLQVNCSPARVASHRAYNRANTGGRNRATAGPNAQIGYYGSTEDAEFLFDETLDEAINIGNSGIRAEDMSNENKEKRDTINYVNYLDKGSDLRLCFICHEEHSALLIGNKIFDPTDDLFKPLRKADNFPVLAFDIAFAARADIPFRVCNRCLSSLKQGSAPPRSVKNFHVLDDEKFMKFFRNLDRIQARLITKVIPITTINLQKVYGESNIIQHAKTTNNTISMRAATSKVIERMLPRSLDDIGMIHFRSRTKNLQYTNTNSKYQSTIVDPKPALLALGVLTGTAEGMVMPLNKFYSKHDTTEQRIIDHGAELDQCDGHFPTIDIMEDDNDDEFGNIEQDTKRKIRTMFGGQRFLPKMPMIYNSRFNAHIHVPGFGAIHAISSACHWDFGGVNILTTCRHFIQLANDTFQNAPLATQGTHILDCIGFTLNADNPNVNMEPRSKFPPIMRCSFSCSDNRNSFNTLLQQCISPPLSAIISKSALQNIGEIKQIIIQIGEDNFKTYVKASIDQPLWYEFDSVAGDTAKMMLPIQEDCIDVSSAFHCWACTAPLLEDQDNNHNTMMEVVRQSMRRFIVHSMSNKKSSLPIFASNGTTETDYSADIDFDASSDQQEFNPDDIVDSIGNMERFVNVEGWDMKKLREAIVDLDIGEGDKTVSGNIVIDSGENGIPVFDYEPRPFTDRETGKYPLDTVGYTFPHLFPDGLGGFNDLRDVKVSLTDWVSHLLHYCEVVEQQDGTFVRVRRFSTALDFCFWLENKIQLQKASGIAFIAGDRAIKRGIHDPLSASAVNSENLAAAIDVAKSMTEKDFCALKTNYSNMSLTHRILRQLEPYGENYLNSYMQTKYVRRCATAALMDPDAIDGADPSVFFTVNQDDANHIDLWKMIHAHKFQNVAAEDIQVEDLDELFPKKQAQAVADNPFMSVKYFHHKKTGILKYLINGLRKPLGGELVDAVIACEFQRGCGLHMHMVGWIARQLNMTPEQLLSCEEGLLHVKNIIANLYDGTIPLGLDCSDLTSSNETFLLNPDVQVPKHIIQAALKKVRSRARPIIPTIHNEREREIDYRYCVIAKQCHGCCFTCFTKGDSCRFNFPRDLCVLCSLELIKDPEKKSSIQDMKIEIPRNHKWINPHTKSYLATSLRCNHDIRYCNNPWGDSMYCLNYSTKGGNPDMNILNRRVHKAICRHSTDATLVDYFKSTAFQLDACRERGIIEVISTLLRFKHVVFTRSCVKLNTQVPEKRKTTLRPVKKPDDNENDIVDTEDAYNNDDANEESEVVYEVSESVASTVIYESYKLRPTTGTCPHINLEWPQVSLIDFVAWYRPCSNATGKNHRVKLLNGTYWMARNRRALVLFYPYIPLNIASEESAYSVLVSYIPFVDENELIPAEFKGSAIAALEAIRNSSILPIQVTERIAMRFNRETLRSDVIAANANANTTFNETLASGITGTSYDLDDMTEDSDINCMDISNEEKSFDSSEQTTITEPIYDDIAVFRTSKREVFQKLSNSLANLKEEFHKHKLQLQVSQNNSAASRENRTIPISSISADMEKLSSSFKQSCAYSLAHSVFLTCMQNEDADRLNMRLSGPAGTGKSTVLLAIIRLARELFIPDIHTGQYGNVIVGAWSGIASHNCGGSTLASIFVPSLSNDRIIEKMRGVKLLIIDEDSTNPLHCLGTIDQQLRIANGSNKPFGNAHVIYAGDMRQLKSVLSTAMYEQPPFNSSTDPKRIAFNNKLSIGRNRYMEISDYIELTKQFRQQKSKQLGDTLGRCRINTEQQKDLDLLNTRFMPNMEEALIEIQSKPNAICLASTRKVVDDINKKFNDSLIDRGKRSIACYALHRKQRTQRTRALASREVANENNDNENQFDQERVLNTTDVLDSGLSSTQRLKCLQHDIDGKSGKLSSCLTLCIGSRVMLIENVDPMLGLVNGTTGTVVGFVYGTFEGSNKIIENPTDINIAATHEPQIPIVLMKVDEEFWTAPQHKFIIKPPLETQRNWERVIAIPPVESRVSYKLKFANGQESVKRIQLPLILAFGITVHKAQGLNKDYVLFIASSRLFARAISYVALSRCTSLEGLYIVGKKITTEHFNQIYGKEDNVIKAETYRLRKFQGNTLRKGYKALCTFKRHLYNEDTPFTFPLDEPEFDA